jgi:hypothetical protein
VLTPCGSAHGALHDFHPLRTMQLGHRKAHHARGRAVMHECACLVECRMASLLLLAWRQLRRCNNRAAGCSPAFSPTYCCNMLSHGHK